MESKPQYWEHTYCDKCSLLSQSHPNLGNTLIKLQQEGKEELVINKIDELFCNECQYKFKEYIKYEALNRLFIKSLLFKLNIKLPKDM